MWGACGGCTPKGGDHTQPKTSVGVCLWWQSVVCRPQMVAHQKAHGTHRSAKKVLRCLWLPGRDCPQNGAKPWASGETVSLIAGGRPSAMCIKSEV